MAGVFEGTRDGVGKWMRRVPVGRPTDPKFAVAAEDFEAASSEEP
jgi:hypothetical protein